MHIPYPKRYTSHLIIFYSKISPLSFFYDLHYFLFHRMFIINCVEIFLNEWSEPEKIKLITKCYIIFESHYEFIEHDERTVETNSGYEYIISSPNSPLYITDKFAHCYISRTMDSISISTFKNSNINTIWWF